MKYWLGLAAVVWAAAFGMAQAADPAPAAQPPVPAVGHAPVDTVVRIELAESLSSSVNFKGNTFAIRLVEPIVGDGGVLVPAGTPGVGEVISSGHAEMGGKAGKLVLAVRYLDFNGRHIPLHGLKLAMGGNDNSSIRSTTTIMSGMAPAIAVVGAMTAGEDVSFALGTTAQAKLGEALTLPILAPSPGQKPASMAAPIHIAAQNEVPPPPAGKAEVVFFRTPGFLNSGRATPMEGDTPIATIGSKSYFVLTVDPGQHTFKASKKTDADTLTLELEPGDIYYVEQGFSAGAFTNQPMLYPSDETTFAMMKKSKLAEPGGKSKS